MLKKSTLLLCLFFIAACTPFVDTRREAGSVVPKGQSTATKTAVCFNGWFTDDDELKTLAENICGDQKVVWLDDVLFSCTLFYPTTAFFECEQ